MIVQIVSDISNGAYAGQVFQPKTTFMLSYIDAATCHDVQHQIWCLLELCIHSSQLAWGPQQDCRSNEGSRWKLHADYSQDARALHSQLTLKQHKCTQGILTPVLEQNITCQGIRSGVVNSRKYINQRVIAILGFQVYIIADTLLQPTSKQSEQNDWCDYHATAFNTGSSYPAKTGM